MPVTDVEVATKVGTEVLFSTVLFVVKLADTVELVNIVELIV